MLAPIVKDRKGSYEDLFINLLNKGFARVRVDGEIKNLEDDISLKKTAKHKIEIVVDRLSIPANISPHLFHEMDSNAIDYKSLGFENEQEFLAFKQRITDSVETCLRYGEGELIINLYDEAKDILFSENLVCKHDKISYPQIEPHTFSFNSPHGACPNCSGLGYIKTIDPQLVYNPNLTIAEGAIFPWSRSVDPNSWYMRQLDALAKKLNFSLKTKMKDLPKIILDEILYGSKTTITLELEGNRFTGQFETKFEGVIPNLERRYRETDSEHIRSEIEKYMVTKTCPICDGTRLRPEALSIRVCGKNIVEVTKMNIEQGVQWIDSLTQIKPELYPANTTFQKNGILYRKLVIDDEEYEEELTLSEPKYEIAKTILKEISTRLKFLMDVGLGYLTLDRNASTLSGGEAQRIRLASQIGSGLSGVLYVLDEPSIGLHQRDNSRLINTLKHLRDIGNTVIVVEHSEETMNEADWIIDMGEGAGINGGNIVAQGTPEEIKKDQFSVTGPFLNKSKIVGSKYLDSKSKKKNSIR